MLAPSAKWAALNELSVGQRSRGIFDPASVHGDCCFARRSRAGLVAFVIVGALMANLACPLLRGANSLYILSEMLLFKLFLCGLIGPK